MLEDYGGSIPSTRGQGTQGNQKEKKKKKIGSTKGSSHTLQDMQEKQAWRNPK